ncbi:F-box only protein 21 [Nilaparvata lugens]|uniref:F-box only protein 21 n=1 Tax=Nilaparvata lugens TaxID=108931 RepID=UPI00193D84BF|nr:F-box only protein 21 [Nilaparvata lugens]
MEEKKEELAMKLYALETVHSTVHDERPDDLKYRVGQVIEHGPFTIRGVIVGWEYHDKDSKYKGPVYTVLLNELPTQDGQTNFIEVPQRDIMLKKMKEAKHRHLKRYFKAFDGTQYLPHDWLRRLYPHD